MKEILVAHLARDLLSLSQRLGQDRMSPRLSAHLGAVGLVRGVGQAQLVAMREQHEIGRASCRERV